MLHHDDEMMVFEPKASPLWRFHTSIIYSNVQVVDRRFGGAPICLQDPSFTTAV